MPNSPPPPSQKNRTIGFAGTTGIYELTIRPEEITRTEPSRLAVQQTLGGAWIDSFDRGIIQIRIAGTTGWRGGPPGHGGLSGEDAFHRLRTQAFIAWHAERAAIVAGGGDPSVVTLVFVDTLDGFTDIVAPKTFVMRRSKSSPLLIRYTIEMLVVQDLASPVGGGGALGTAFSYLQGALQIEGFADAVGDAANGLLDGLGFA